MCILSGYSPHPPEPLTHMHTHVHIHAHADAHTHTCTHTCTRTRTHTHAYTHTHVHTHTHTSQHLPTASIIVYNMYNGRCGEIQGLGDSTNVVACGTVRTADSQHYGQVPVTCNTSRFGHLHDGLNRHQHFMTCVECQTVALANRTLSCAMPNPKVGSNCKSISIHFSYMYGCFALLQAHQCSALTNMYSHTYGCANVDACAPPPPHTHHHTPACVNTHRKHSYTATRYTGMY